MSHVSSDPNYTDQSSTGNPIERVGDLTGEPPTNESLSCHHRNWKMVTGLW
jgi:hypothetical protein